MAFQNSEPFAARKAGNTMVRGFLVVFLGAVLLTGCSWLGLDDSASDDQNAEYIERPVEQIYNDAWKQIADHNWEKAAKQFDEVERQHPYSVWARRAMLMSAFWVVLWSRFTSSICS